MRSPARFEQARPRVPPHPPSPPWPPGVGGQDGRRRRRGSFAGRAASPFVHAAPGPGTSRSGVAIIQRDSARASFFEGCSSAPGQATRWPPRLPPKIPSKAPRSARPRLRKGPEGQAFGAASARPSRTPADELPVTSNRRGRGRGIRRQGRRRGAGPTGTSPAGGTLPGSTRMFFSGRRFPSMTARAGTAAGRDVSGPPVERDLYSDSSAITRRAQERRDL